MRAQKPSFDLDERKKRILAIAGVATVVLLFVSFLVSLTTGSDDNSNAAVQTSEEITLEDNSHDTSVKVPASVRYSYDAQPESDMSSGTIEPDTVDQNQDPFANMNSSENTEQAAPVQQESDLAPGIEEQKQFLSYLYCGSFDSDGAAQQEKAKIAFAGIISTVASYKGTLTLKIGPFNNRDEARAKFHSLSEKGLLSTCELVDE